MNYKGAPMIMRLDAAKIAAPLVHRKPKPQVAVVERSPRAHVVPRHSLVTPYAPVMARQDQRGDQARQRTATQRPCRRRRGRSGDCQG
jgi:hypothetical protein